MADIADVALLKGPVVLTFTPIVPSAPPPQEQFFSSWEELVTLL